MVFDVRYVCGASSTVRHTVCGVHSGSGMGVYWSVCNIQCVVCTAKARTCVCVCVCGGGVQLVMCGMYGVVWCGMYHRPAYDTTDALSRRDVPTPPHQQQTVSTKPCQQQAVRTTP